MTDDGAERLAAELERAHEVVDPPLTVWLWDHAARGEVRGMLHGWRDGDPRRGLVVWQLHPLHDCVEWLCEPFLRPRNE